MLGGAGRLRVNRNLHSHIRRSMFEVSGRDARVDAKSVGHLEESRVGHACSSRAEDGPSTEVIDWAKTVEIGADLHSDSTLRTMAPAPTACR